MYEQAVEYEDKKCRICGYADKENINIFCKVPNAGFGRSNYGNLYEKITTVYPMVLYEDDPLPKNICKKCANNVSNTYNDIQKVIRQQQRWIENVRNIQPDNTYLTVLKMIQSSVDDVTQQLQFNYNVDIKGKTLSKLFIKSKTPNNETKEESIVSDNFVKNIQSKLEQNGCTVKKVKIPYKSCYNNIDSTNVVTLPNYEIQSEYSLDENEFTEPVILSCKYCPLKFEDMKELAKHQVDHLELSVDRIFKKHILPTNLRRGRLITIDGKKSIRCLNCWRIFSDQNAILLHWNRGDCDYYCLICDEEFREAPKLLREHTTEVHGINYRSAKRLFSMASKNQIISTISGLCEKQISSPSTDRKSSLSQIHANAIARAFQKAKSHTAQASKHTSSTTICPICDARFSNWRSRNSHMRKHKPSVKYGDVVLPPETSKDKYETLSGCISHNKPNHITTLTTNQVKFPIRYMGNSGRPSFNKMYAEEDYKMPENSSLAETSTTLMDDDDIVIKMEPLGSEDDEDQISTSQQIIDENLVETIIKSEPLDIANQLLVDLAETNEHNDNDGEEMHCFTCNAAFYSITEFEKHTMFAHNPNFDI